jgi:prepilin-type N-terminal cleavage/methylation domain-containing protein
MRSLIKINKRSGSRKAFTLAELLIVVAIIGVLVGISIPIFMAQKEKSAEATDIANMRAAKAAAVAAYYNGINAGTARDNGFRWWQDPNGTNQNAWAMYNVETGGFESPATGKFDQWGLTADDAYGQGTAKVAGAEYTGYYGKYDYTKAVITVTIYYDCTSTQAQNIIKKFNGGAYYKNGLYDGKYTTNDLKNLGCIIIEWRNYDGTYINSNKTNRLYGEIIFLEP